MMERAKSFMEKVDFRRSLAQACGWWSRITDPELTVEARVQQRDPHLLGLKRRRKQRRRPAFSTAFPRMLSYYCKFSGVSGAFNFACAKHLIV
jgi:hypothetical protein